MEPFAVQCECGEWRVEQDEGERWSCRVCGMPYYVVLDRRRR